MIKAEKLLKRFLSRPMNFTFYELSRLLESMDYKEEQGSGFSRGLQEMVS
jgi:hypothetical protein